MMQTLVYTPAMQGMGEFDGGKIREQKPIGFSGEGSVIKRVGPLFYWAWATSSTDAKIGLHPHQGFEIMTYVVEGSAFHGDTLGTDSVVGAGGVQLMQTGSGVSHQERLSANAELFQIWFEPDLAQALKRTPTYRQYEHEQFPQKSDGAGYSVKTLIGGDAPIELEADVQMWDVQLERGAHYRHPAVPGYTLTALAIRGQGTWEAVGGSRGPAAFQHKDFIVATADAETEIDVHNAGEDALRLIIIQVPTRVDYPLYPKR